MPDVDIPEIELKHAALFTKLDETHWCVLAKCECGQLIDRKLPIPVRLALLSRTSEPAPLFRAACVRNLVKHGLVSVQTHPPEPTELGRTFLQRKLGESW